MPAREKTVRAPSRPRRSAAERLCEVAGELFYRRGIRAVGVDEIVAETGLTKPTLYRNFASKDELVSTCLRARRDAMGARLEVIAGCFADDPAGHLRAIVQLFADDIAEPDFRGCGVMNAAVEFPEADHPVRRITEGCKAEIRARLAGLTRAMAVDDHDTLADGLVLLIDGASTSRHISGSQGPSAALVKAADALIGAYRAAEPVTS